MRLRELCVAACVLSCTSGSNQAPTRKALPPGVAASVGGDLVHSATIARIARARGVAPSEARDLAISDALFAAWARADSANAPAVVVAERAALGRALLEQLEAQATALGPPSDTELDALVAERWTEFDRPPRVRTTHAVILVKKPEDAAPVQALAQKLASELDGSTESALFVEKARAFDAKPFELVAERLSPVTADGRVWDPDARPGQQFGTYEVDYARAANALERPGDHSPVVKTVFGYHVILLEERLPELRVPLEERRAALHDDVISRRTKKLLESTLAELHKTTAVERERTEDVLTELVSRSP